MRTRLISLLFLLAGLLHGQTPTVITYQTSGSASYNVPAGTTTIVVKAWGAGGGGSDSTGGCGGFVQGTFAAQGGDVLNIHVGAGGSYSLGSSATAVQWTRTGATYGWIIAGSGGNGGEGPEGGTGGTGGGTTGGDGVMASSDGGGGGTQSSGGGGGWDSGGQAGAAGTGPLTTQGISARNGGAGGYGDGASGGRGGSGYYGGGGGGGTSDDDPEADESAAGGGGGSSYTSGATSVTSLSGSETPPNTADSHYIAGKGYGQSNGDGSGGLVVLMVYVNPAPIISSATAVSATQGQATTYTIAATNNPTSFAASGLPLGLTVNANTGVVSGASAVPGTITSTISATNAYGTGSATLTWTIASVTDGTPPSAPTGLYVPSTTPPSLTLNWNPSPDNVGTTGYEVRRDGVSLGPVATTSTTITGVVENTSYALAVRARDYAGNWSAWSEVTVTTTNDDDPLNYLTLIYNYSHDYSNGWEWIKRYRNDQSFSIRLNVYSSSGDSIEGTTSSSNESVTLAPSGVVEIQGSETDEGGWTSWSDQEITTDTPLVPPTIKSALTKSATEWEAISSYTISAANPSGETMAFNATGLPAGLSVNTTTGVISGTPTVPGTYSVGISATNAYGTGSATLVLTVNQSAITSSGTASGTRAVPFSYTITASNSPTSFTVGGALPAGLTLNTSTGAISGTPIQPGSFTAVVGAVNGTGTARRTLLINILPPSPAITNSNAASGTQGHEFTFAIAATESPTSYSYTGTLPSGLSLNTTTGVISGTPTQYGNFTPTIRATNAGGTGTAVLAIAIQPPVPVITSAGTATSAVGQSFNYSIAATNSPASYSVASPLPAGLTVNTATGAISGTPTKAGTFDLIIRAHNATGTGAASLVLTVSGPPEIRVRSSVTGSVGVLFSYRISATNSPTSYGVTGTLPSGVSVNTSTGVISGTPTQAGTFNVTLVATNSVGSGTAALAIITVSDGDSDGTPDAVESLLGTNQGTAGSADGTDQMQFRIQKPVQ